MPPPVGDVTHGTNLRLRHPASCCPLLQKAEKGPWEECPLLPAPITTTLGPGGGHAPQGPPNVSNLISPPMDTKVLKDNLFRLCLQNTEFSLTFPGPRKKLPFKQTDWHTWPTLPVSVLLNATNTQLVRINGHSQARVWRQMLHKQCVHHHHQMASGTAERPAPNPSFLWLGLSVHSLKVRWVRWMLLKGCSGLWFSVL